MNVHPIHEGERGPAIVRYECSVQPGILPLSASNAWLDICVKHTVTSSAAVFQGDNVECEPFYYSLSSGALDFWSGPEEDVYEAQDGEPL